MGIDWIIWNYQSFNLSARYCEGVKENDKTLNIRRLTRHKKMAEGDAFSKSMKSQTQVCEKEVCSVEEVDVGTWQTPPNEKASPGQIEALPKITCSFNFLDS